MTEELYSSAILFKNLITSFEVFLSRLPVGSSKKINSGLLY